MPTSERDISGGDLLRFYLANGFIAPKGTDPITLCNNGFVEVCPYGDEETLYNPVYILVAQPKVPRRYLRNRLRQDGFSEEQFWGWINAKG